VFSSSRKGCLLLRSNENSSFVRSKCFGGWGMGLNGKGCSATAIRRTDANEPSELN